MKYAFLVSVVLAQTAAFAYPKVSDVTLTARGGSKAYIDYTLENEPAIVMVDIQTNTLASGSGEWVSIGEERLAGFEGAQCLVTNLGPNRIKWHVREAWPDQDVAAARAVVTAFATNAPPDYMSVALADGTVRYYFSTNQLPGGIGSDVWRTDHMLFRKVPAAGVQWRMGSPSNETGRPASNHFEFPHAVMLSHDFYLGVFEVTQKQYALITGSWPSRFANEAFRETRPVENVNFNDHVIYNDSNWPGTKTDPSQYSVSSETFVGKLRKKCTVLDKRLILPTRTQWEFAARGGRMTSLYDGHDLVKTGSADSNLDRLGRYKFNGGYVNGTDLPDYATADTSVGTARVGSYEPNAYGLYDMLGNVAEMTLDWHGRPLADHLDFEVDPFGLKTADKDYTTTRSACGGSWRADGSKCRVSAADPWQMWLKDYQGDSFGGFRMCCNLP